MAPAPPDPPPQLSAIFLSHARPAARDALAAAPLLEATLAHLVRETREAWPELPVDPERFIAFLARHLPAQVATTEQLAALRANDLYLVCAYGMGVPAAQQRVEADHLPRVARGLRRIGCAPAEAADILQELRCRLIDMQDPAVRRRGYSGRSDLSGWLCLSGIRAAGMHRRQDRRERPLEQAPEVVLARGADPESEALRERFKDQFQAAFREAVAALSSRERNLLRYHYLSGLSIDQIAQLHDIHRATAARRLARAEEHLVELTRTLFLASIPMGAISLTQIPTLIQSRISLDLARVLRR